MALLTDQIAFTGTPADSDVIHMVDVSDTTQNPAGTSFKVHLSALTSYYDISPWSAGTGTNSAVLKNSGSNATGSTTTAGGINTVAGGIASVSFGTSSKAFGNYSAVLGGTNNNTDTDNSGIFVGINNTISGASEGNSGIFAGSNNILNGTSTESVILGGDINEIQSSASAIIGGQENKIENGAHNIISGGHQHTISGTVTDSAIIGGFSCSTDQNNVVILGCTNLFGSTSDMTYMNKIYLDNCPAYADDAAAGVGGLTTGMVYQTTGTGAAPLNVAGILMIKQ